jgi:hypothetical protein
VLLGMLLRVLLWVLPVWRRGGLWRHRWVLPLWPWVVHLGILLQLRGRRPIHAVLIMSRGRGHRRRRIRLWGMIYGRVWSRHLSGGHDIWRLCVLVSAGPRLKTHLRSRGLTSG